MPPSPAHRLLPGDAWYLLLMLGAVIGTAVWWSRRFRSDPALIQIFAGAVVGAFAGAKLAYLLAEGFLHWGAPDFWRQAATGKTILGALLGGYAGVEGVKAVIGHRQPTGDGFAAVAPLGIAMGRLGCVAHGCCQGAVCGASGWRWPAPWVELGFNLAAFVCFLMLRRRGWLAGQHFHLFLIGYGLFRFAHEFVRETPRLWGPFTGYHGLAVAVAALGVGGFVMRARANKMSACQRG